MGYGNYLALRWFPVVFAIILLGVLALLLPRVILGAFELNALWTPWAGAAFAAIGEKLIAPHLVPGAWEAVTGTIAGMHAAYGGMVKAIHAVTEQLPSEYGARSEVFVRGYLLEGWLVIAEVAAIIRLLIARYLA